MGPLFPRVGYGAPGHCAQQSANRVAEQAANRTRGIRIVSTNGRFTAHVQCDRFSAHFDGNDFAAEMHEKGRVGSLLMPVQLVRQAIDHHLKPVEKEVVLTKLLTGRETLIVRGYMAAGQSQLDRSRTG